MYGQILNYILSTWLLQPAPHFKPELQLNRLISICHILHANLAYDWMYCLYAIIPYYDKTPAFILSNEKNTCLQGKRKCIHCFPYQISYQCQIMSWKWILQWLLSYSNMLMQSSLSNYFICEINAPLFIQHYSANGYCICIGHFVFPEISLSHCTQDVSFMFSCCDCRSVKTAVG